MFSIVCVSSHSVRLYCFSFWFCMQGTEAIQSIVLHYFWVSYEKCWRDKTFLNMSQLKFLNLAGMNFSLHLKLPSSLKVLHLENCYLETLPLTDQQYELVEIKLLFCEKIVQLWHGEKVRPFTKSSIKFYHINLLKRW